MITISIHQPNYIPWLGYFYKIYSSDIFVFHDDAKFSESGAHNYHYIKTPQGPFRLKIPINNSTGNRIMDIKTKDELGWKDKHLTTIEHNYKRAPFFKVVFNDFEALLLAKYENLAEMNETLIVFFCQKFGFRNAFYKSSDLKLTSSNEQKIFDTCQKLGGSIYFSGRGAEAYQNEEHFSNAGIILKYSDYHSFQYRQLWGFEFQGNVTVLDYLMNCGYDWGRVLKNL